MVVILPLSSFAWLFLIFLAYSVRRSAPACWRSAFLAASVAWGVILTAVTEVLSLFGAITFPALSVAWALISLTLALLCWSLRATRTFTPLVCLNTRPTSHFEIPCLIGATSIVALVGLIAIISPPNTWDSMTYHMSRVQHWIQYRSVTFYPTHIERQLFSQPWSEFAILHFQVLSGGDRFANLVQWFAMIGSGIGVSVIARQMGAGRRGQIFATVVSVTIPMGILQGSSTQNDYVVAFWLVCLVHFLLCMHTENSRWYPGLAGAAVGLAILTKGTAFLFAPSLLVWSGCLAWKRWRRGLARGALLGVAIAVAITLGHVSRNMDAYGRPLGTERYPAGMLNQVTGVRWAASNVLRNLTLHMGTPIKKINARIESWVQGVHSFLGVDMSDRRTTYLREVFHVVGYPTDEDYAGNLFHLALMLISVPILCARHARGVHWIVLLYCLGIVVSFLLFVTSLKWQPWHSRLQLPLFVLWSPATGIMLSQTRAPRVGSVVAGALLLCSLPWVLFNSSRPLLGFKGRISLLARNRGDLYFSKRSELKDAYLGATRFLRSGGCRNIGLLLGEDDWEYPVWQFLQGDDRRTVWIRHINVTNGSRAISPGDTPGVGRICGVISLTSQGEKTLVVESGVFERQWLMGPVGVFVRQDSAQLGLPCGLYGFEDTGRNSGRMNPRFASGLSGCRQGVSPTSPTGSRAPQTAMQGAV